MLTLSHLTDSDQKKPVTHHRLISFYGKPSLLVVGTPYGQQVPSKEQKGHNDDDTHNTPWMWVVVPLVVVVVGVYLASNHSHPVAPKPS